MPREAHSIKASPQITVQCDIGGLQIAFIEQVESLTLDEVTQHLDLYRNVISRQRAQQALIEALVDVDARQKRLVELDTAKAQALRDIAEEKARTRAAWEAGHQAMGRRADFKMTDPQKKALVQFDERIQQKDAEFEAERARLERELPLYEAQVSRQRAIIAGRERAEVIGPTFLEAAE